MTLNTVLQAIAITIGIVISLYKLRQLVPRGGNDLKTDLEILKLLEPSDPNYPKVKARVDAGIKRIYTSQDSKAPKVYDWTSLIMGVIFLSLFVWWTIYLVRDGFTWWAIATGYGALVGLSTFLAGFRKKNVVLEHDENIK